MLRVCVASSYLASRSAVLCRGTVILVMVTTFCATFALREFGFQHNPNNRQRQIASNSVSDIRSMLLIFKFCPIVLTFSSLEGSCGQLSRRRLSPGFIVLSLKLQVKAANTRWMWLRGMVAAACACTSVTLVTC